MTCPACKRRDFASSLRCQWCGQPLREGVAPLRESGALVEALAPNSVPLPRGAFDATPPPPLQSSQSLLYEGALATPAASVPVVAPPEAEGKGKNSMGKKAGGWASLLAVMLAKSKALLAALKFGKLATTFGSMFVSIAVYAAIYSWKFAVGFVGLIFVHEMGHVLALKRRGIPIEGMFFIPFLGAAVSFKKRPADPAVDAEISAAGPLAGWLGGLVCAAIYAQNGEPFWLVMAHVTFLINLINLAPATPLDGGWIVRAINPKFSLVGAAIGAAIGFYMHSTILVVVAVLGAINFAKTSTYGDDDIYKKQASPAARTRVTAMYLGLLIALGASLGLTTHALQAVRDARAKSAPTSSATATPVSFPQ